MPEVEEEFVDVGGVRTRFLRAGAGDIPLILLHGISSSANTWALTIAALSPKRRIVALDLLGCGWTDKPEDASYSPEEMVTHFAAFLDVLGIERADVNGWSMGGRIALDFAKRNPARVRRLVLTAPAGIGTGTHLLFRMAAQPTLGSYLTHPIYIGFWVFFKMAVHPKSHIPKDLVREVVSMMRAPGAHSAFLKQVRSMVDFGGFKIEPRHDLLTGLEAVSCPVMALWGRQDKVVPVVPADRLSALLPDYRLEVIDECGHFPQWEHPRLYNDQLEDFLSDD